MQLTDIFLPLTLWALGMLVLIIGLIISSSNDD